MNGVGVYNGVEGSREHFGGAGDLGVCWLVCQCSWY